MEEKLTHFDEKGNAIMVDVTEKKITSRTATASGKIHVNEAVMKALSQAYTGRRLKKRDFRSLWITRISAACKMNGMNYSTFMHGLKVAGITINRKMLAEMAVNDAAAFTQLAEIAKKA